jgi:hypothetical protein
MLVDGLVFELAFLRGIVALSNAAQLNLRLLSRAFGDSPRTDDDFKSFVEHFAMEADGNAHFVLGSDYDAEA